MVGVRDGVPLDLGPPLQQAIAAMLATRSGRVVTLPQLIEGLWGDDPPPSAQQSVYTYVAGLRRAFEPGRGRREPPRTVVKAPGGYLLRLDPLRTDVHLFAARLEAADQARRSGDLPSALRTLDEALVLWRGPALSGVPGLFADGERARLDELHVLAVEARAEVLTGLGRPEDALAALHDLTRRHPLRERPRELLMLALHASGRQAQALQVFEEARRVLADELGADPGEGLRRAHRLALTPPEEPPAPDGGRMPAQGPPPQDRRQPHPTRPRQAPPGAQPASPRNEPHGQSGAEGASPPRETGEHGAAPPRGAGEHGAAPSHEADARASSPSREEFVPRQLPRALAGFVGRTREIVRLTSLLDPWGDEAPHPFVVICGAPGVGKSTLAVRVAHAVRHRFPDGQLYVNLRGGTPNVPRPSAYEVLSRLLRGLGTPDNAVPADEDEAAALLRSALHGRRLLVLLDDAAGLAQVRPFTAAPPGTTVLVTSRESLVTGADRAQVRLGPLSDAEATAMLANLAGADRVAADLGQTGRLVRLCDGFPLALRIAGARLADRPDWSVGALTERLTDERRRLRELEAGELAVRSSLAASWTALSGSAREIDAAAARLLALLGLLHVPDITLEAAAALSGGSETDVERALERLCDAHLLEAGEPGRYHPHDLVRLFASDLLPAGERTAPLLRAFGFYAESVRTAARTSDPHRVHCLHPPVQAAGRSFRDAAEADDWLRTEEATLLAAAVQAMADPDDGVARAGAAIGAALWWYQQKSYRVRHLVATGERLVATGERLQDQVIAMHGHAHLATGLYFKGDPASVTHNERHLALAKRLGDRFNEQRAHGNLSSTLLKWERFEEALDHALAQRVIACEIGSDVGERYALLVAGRAYLELGRFDEAAGVLEEGAAMAERAGDPHSRVEFAVWQGRALIDMGRLDTAFSVLSETLEPARSTSRTTEMACLVHLTRVHRLLGQLGEAVRRSAEAVAVAERAGSSYWLERAIAERDEAASGQRPARTRRRG
ncbi:BTAD domain-containing putative transcriptional regulator [Nonomuraea salmonea]|uniref:BTAD domain-containing putative transcriptional regulator n=1 Tax=Nonomuraea salmonea TaxID=46181 RepID=A0ABV5NL23_9ACTN